MDVTKLPASVWQEGDTYVAQCLSVDVASCGETESQALENLSDAVTLHFTPPVATKIPQMTWIEVNIRAA